MSQPLQILVVGEDPRLDQECRAALNAATDATVVVYYVQESRRALEVARSRCPALVVVEMSTNLKLLRTIADEFASALPETRLVGAFTPEIFLQDVSESAVLLEAMRSGATYFLRRPISADDVRQLVERLQQPQAAASRARAKVVTFVGNKGGVGKSTLAVNTAVGLAQRHPGRVLLIDASLQLGVCAVMLHLRPALSLTDAAREQDRLDEMLLQQLATPHNSGLHLLAAPSDVLEATEVSDEVISHVLSLAQRTYDYVIVDTFPMVDRVMITVYDQSDLLYIVLENVAPTILGVAKLLKTLASIGVSKEKQRFVINRYHRMSGGLQPRDAAQMLGRDIQLVVPFDRKLIRAADMGRPYLLAKRPFSSTARRLRELVDDVEELNFSVPGHALNGRSEPGAG
ncbi:MAG: AAA family ATPase [Planctomycetaceae bacterium]|nr:AAA family ATPase [Planctomycetaceae bacterium]